MNKITLTSILFLFSSLLIFAQPNWEPVIYTNSTTAYATVKIDGSAATESDIVGAFVGSECRAKGEVVINAGVAYTTLLIQGEQVEEVGFKIYDASADEIYNVDYTTQSSPGGTIGLPPNFLLLEVTTQTNSLEVSPSNQAVSEFSGTTTFSVVSNISWTVSEAEDWLSVTPSNGSNDGILTVTFDANTTTSQRIGTITVSGGGITREVTLTQQGKQLKTYNVTLTSNPESGGTTTGSGQYNENSTVSVTAVPNEGWEFIYWTENDSQVSTDSIYQFTLESDRNLIANFYQISCTPNWEPVIYTNSTTAYGLVTIYGQAASSEDIVGAFVNEECRAVGNVVLNQGNAYVTLLIQGEIVETVKFKLFDKSECAILDNSYFIDTNPGGTIGLPPNFLPLEFPTIPDSLEVTPPNREVDAAPGTTTFNVVSNTSWTVSKTDMWLSLSNTSGSNNDTLVVNYDTNATTSERIGTITVTGGGITREVTVTQSGTAIRLVVSPSNQAVGSSAGNISFAITSNISWRVSKTDTWLSLSDTSGSNDATLTVTYDANSTTSERIGRITVTGGGITREVTVIQSGATVELAVSPSNQEVGSSGGNTNFAITSNISWTVSKTDTWLSLSDTSGSNDAILTVTYDTNATTSIKIGTITVTGGGLTREVTVTQSGASLPGKPILLSPANNIEIPDSTENIKFEWTSVNFAKSYIIEVSTDSLFNDIDGLTDTTITDTTKTYKLELRPDVYYWRIRGKNVSGYGNWSNTFVLTIYMLVDVFENTIPQEFVLHQNYPNPFNPSTMIKYGIPEQSNVKIEIFNMLGQSVGVLVNTDKSVGFYETTWSAANLPSGIYLISIKAEGLSSKKNFTQVKKALLLK